MRDLRPLSSVVRHQVPRPKRTIPDVLKPGTVTWTLLNLFPVDVGVKVTLTVQLALAASTWLAQPSLMVN